jgi:murein DD-endopeptidase MepM/ murein hydrolase activator NlpD
VTGLPGIPGDTASATAGAAGGADASAGDRDRIAGAAKEFEAMFLLQMLKQMRQAMLQDEDAEPGLGAATMFDTIDSELARALAAQGTGLAPVLVKGLTRVAGLAPAPSAASGPGAVAPAGFAITPEPRAPRASTAPAGPRAGSSGAVAEGSHAEGTSLSPAAAPDLFEDPLADRGRGKVTSAFGWRRDPFTGRTRYHGGVDLRAAYGEPVASAAAGRVVFAGVQGGYGRTVIVEHAPGLQTRYAHLSQLEVAEGDAVGAGDEIGRVGRSGRATGPHLHFEVMQDGRRVDPASGARRLAAALKLQAPPADYPTGSAGTAAGTSGADE